ncbi:MAG: dihydrofolate reductase family protein [Methylocystis sp.]|nr:dihydrofolate reductase family protein [Methylocystis sp.]
MAMQPIVTLFERSSAAPGPGLSPRLKEAYGGDLCLPLPTSRPVYVAANFVTTLDGVASYQLPGQSGGGAISGFNEQDQFIMGLLRSLTDAVLIGSGTLHGDAGHVRIPEFVYPRLREEFRSFRQAILHKPIHPLNVVITGSGEIRLDEPTFHTPELSTLIITNETGRRRLRRDHGDALAVTQVRTVAGGGRVSPSDALKILREEFGVERLALEGGPTLLGQFLAEGLVDELFLTLSPHVAGRSEADARPGLIAQMAFLPENAPRFDLLSLKMAHSHLYARYQRRAA